MFKSPGLGTELWTFFLSCLVLPFMIMPLALPYSQGSCKSGGNALVPSDGDFVPIEVGSVTFKLGRWNLKTNNKKVIFLMEISKHAEVNNDTQKYLSSSFNNYQFFANLDSLIPQLTSPPMFFWSKSQTSYCFKVRSVHLVHNCFSVYMTSSTDWIFLLPGSCLFAWQFELQMGK